MESFKSTNWSFKADSSFALQKSHESQLLRQDWLRDEIDREEQPQGCEQTP